MGRFACAIGLLEGGDMRTPWPGKRPGLGTRKTHRAQTPRPSRAGQAGGRRGGRQAGQRGERELGRLEGRPGGEARAGAGEVAEPRELGPG
eukprot:8133778-Alexandrium_andersonii.AAC.1